MNTLQANTLLIPSRKVNLVYILPILILCQDPRNRSYRCKMYRSSCNIYGRMMNKGKRILWVTYMTVISPAYQLYAKVNHCFIFEMLMLRSNTNSSCIKLLGYPSLFVLLQWLPPTIKPTDSAILK